MSFTLSRLDDHTPNLRGICVLSALMPSTDSDEEAPETSAFSPAPFSPPRRRPLAKNGMLSPTRTHFPTRPQKQAMRTPSRRFKRDAYQWQLVGLRVVRGHWALIIERTYEAVSTTAAAPPPPSTTSTSTIPRSPDPQNNPTPPPVAPPLGSYEPAAVASPARRNLESAATVKRKQQMIVVLDSVPSEQLLDNNERTWLLRLIRGELGTSTTGRHQPNMLCSLHEGMLANVQFSSEATGGGGENGQPLQLFAMEPKGVVYVWLWRGERFRWMWLNRISLDRDHLLSQSRRIINYIVYMSDEKLLVWSTTHGDKDEIVKKNKDVEEDLEEGRTKEGKKGTMTNDAESRDADKGEKEKTIYGTRACKVHLVRRAQPQPPSQPQQPLPPPPQQQPVLNEKNTTEQEIQKTKKTTMPIKRLLTMAVGPVYQYDEIASQLRQHMCCTSLGVWTLDRQLPESVLVVQVWSTSNGGGALKLPLPAGTVILGCCQDQTRKGPVLFLNNKNNVLMLDVAVNHTSRSTHCITSTNLCTLQRPDSIEHNDEDLSFISHGHSLIVLSSNICQIYDRSTGLHIASISVPSHHDDVGPLRHGTWSLNLSFGRSGILTEYGVWSIVPPTLQEYGRLLKTAAAACSTTSNVDVSRRLIAMASMHGPSGERLAAHYQIAFALDTNNVEANDMLWSKVTAKSLQNPVIPLASSCMQNPGLTFASKMMETFFDEKERLDDDDYSPIARMTPLNMSLMNDLSEMRQLVGKARETLVFGEDEEEDSRKDDCDHNDDDHLPLSLMTPWMEIDALVEDGESLRSLMVLEAMLRLKQGEGIDGILWPPSHPLLSPEVLPSDAALSSPTNANTSANTNTNTSTSTTIASSDTFNAAASSVAVSSVASSSSSSSSSSSITTSLPINPTYTNRLFERLCRLYHRHRPRALTRFVELVEEQYARTMGTMVRGDTWSGPVARRACQCLPLLSSPSTSASFLNEDVDDATVEDLDAVRLEARVWLLLVSGEPVLAIRTLLARCDWETSIAFCEHASGRKEGKGSEERVRTLLFEEVLTYCLSTHGPAEMLQRVFPLMPDGYTLDQLLACIAPYELAGNGERNGGLVADGSGSAASFGALQAVMERLSKERYAAH